MEVSRKFWQEVDEAIQRHSITFKGDLAQVHLKDNRAVCLNLNGQGFVDNRKSRFEFNRKIYQPLYILEKVLEQYIQIKGYTTYFSKKREELQKERSR